MQAPAHSLALAPAPHRALSPTIRLLIHQTTANLDPLSRVQIPSVPVNVFQHSYLQVVYNPSSYTIPQALELEAIFSSSGFCMLTLQKVWHTSLLLTEIPFQAKKSLLSFFTPPSTPSCLSPLYNFCYMLAILIMVQIYIDYQAKIAIKIHLIFLSMEFYHFSVASKINYNSFLISILSARNAEMLYTD